MDALFILSCIAFIIWSIRNILSWTLLWQDKDYNPRRLFYHLKETARGRNILFSPLSIVKWIAFGLYFYTIFEERNVQIFHITVIFIYITQAFFVVKDLLSSSRKRPYFNSISLVVLILSAVTFLAIFSYPLLDKFFWLLFTDRIMVLFISLYVFVVSFPVELKSDSEVEKAIKKIKSHKDLMTIGIVGSYGKSSTKEFLYQFLSKDYKVIKTQGHQNTIAEIAHTVITKIKKNTQIFIVEMNDFTKGDIEKITKVVRPNIGIITGVNPQYLSLFRTLNESINSKSELITSLPNKSLVLFNGNDKEVKKMYDHAKKTKKLYAVYANTSQIESDKRLIYATNKKIRKDSISFNIVFGTKNIHIVSPLIGIQNIENLLPAIYLADYLGLKESEIKKTALTLTPPENTMIVMPGDTGAIFIDDTSNTNPESLLAALDYMKLYKRKKYVVMQTMIELGKEAEKTHKKIAHLIAEQCEVLFITNKDYIKVMSEAIKKKNSKCKVLHISSSEIASYISKNSRKGDVFLFEGEEARKVLEKLI